MTADPQPGRADEVRVLATSIASWSMPLTEKNLQLCATALREYADLLSALDRGDALIIYKDTDDQEGAMTDDPTRTRGHCRRT